jgi:RimJ/RimL family protein N-acetyltransferase
MTADRPAPPAWIASRRLRLREFVPRDRTQLVRMHADARLRALLIDDRPLHRHDVCAEFLDRLQSLYRRCPGLGIWHAERSVARCTPEELASAERSAALSAQALQRLREPAQVFVGWFNLMPMPHRAGEVELGARLVPGAWGLGLADEGGQMLLQHAFERLGLARVWAVSHPRHDAVRGCVLALGFEDQGLQSYGDIEARHFAISSSRWSEWHTRSRRARWRLAADALRHDEQAVDA